MIGKLGKLGKLGKTRKRPYSIAVNVAFATVAGARTGAPAAVLLVTASRKHRNIGVRRQTQSDRDPLSLQFDPQRLGQPVKHMFRG